MKAIERLEVLKDFVQEAVDKGATSVQQIHQYIADLPFEALEKSGLLDDDRMQLRDRQRRTIGMVYDAIRRINKQVGDLISDQFENLEDAGTVMDVVGQKNSGAKAKVAAPADRKSAAKKSAPKKPRQAEKAPEAEISEPIDFED